MRILHPTDFSKVADKALELARDLSERLGARLDVVHVQQRFENQQQRAYLGLDTLSPAITARLEESRAEEVRNLRSRLAALTPEGGQGDLLWGDPVRELLAILPNYDLVVMGAHGAGRLDHFFLGGVAGRLVRRSPKPVVTVREECQDTSVRRLLLATDFGEASRFALEQCQPYREAGIELVLAHVIEDWRLRDDSAHVRQVDEALSEMAAGRAKRQVVREGDPVTVLPALAQEVGADVIVIGARRHPAMVGLVMGSRADALVRSSPVPVMSVPYQDERGEAA